MAAVLVESVYAAEPFTPRREQIGTHNGRPLSVRSDFAGVVTDAHAGGTLITAPTKSTLAKAIRITSIALNPPMPKGLLRQENRM
jgi:hypothetical protein